MYLQDLSDHWNEISTVCPVQSSQPVRGHQAFTDMAPKFRKGPPLRVWSPKKNVLNLKLHLLQAT